MATGAQLLTPTTEYPWLSWQSVRTAVDKMWDPENCPHHSIVGLTGSGKSYLAVNGLLEMCKYDRVLIIDTKGDDPSLMGVGKPIKEHRRKPWYAVDGEKDKPKANWFRLVVDDNLEKARDQVGRALSSVYDDGDWVVYCDEIFDITSRDKTIGLGLEGLVTQIWRKGRYRHVSLIAGTQTPVSVPRLFYDQASFAWIGRIRDEDRQKRLLEIGGMSKRDLPILAGLKRREWLLAADNGEYFARTIVSNGKVVARGGDEL
jgi:DNA helicase HerA-like ATPase